MVLHRSGRAAGGLVTVAFVTAGLAASLGAGYTVAQATLDDSSAYVSKGTAVSHVNGESRRVDATSSGPALGKTGDRVITTKSPEGKVVAINQRTGAVVTLDPGTMSRTSTVTPKQQVVQPPETVSSGKQGWLVDYDAKAVRPMREGVAVGGVEIEGRPVDAAPGPDGSIVVLTREGKLFRAEPGGRATEIKTEDGRRGSLTVADGRTFLVTTSGAVIDVYGESASKIATVAGLDTGSNGRMLVGGLSGSGTRVLIVSQATLTTVDAQTGEVGKPISLRTDEDSLGEPVEYRNRVYVPNYPKHQLIVVDLARRLVLPQPVKVPGTQSYFDLFVSGGKLWANDQYAQQLVQLDEDGKHTVDKGTGNGTRPDPKPTKVPPARTPTAGPPPSTPQPGNSGTRPSGSSTPTTDPDATPRTVAVPEVPDGSFVDQACSTIIAAQLRCNRVANEDTAKEPDEVIRVAPGPGTKVPTGSIVTVIYAGPVEVPAVATGSQPIEACRSAVQLAKLKCAYAPSDRPATDPQQYGTVAGTDPSEGTKVTNGSTVTIRYFDSFVLPDYTGRNGKSACERLSALSLVLPDAAGNPRPAVHPKCDTTERDSATKGNGKKAGDVYQQQPGAGGVYRSGQAVALTVYSGEADLPDYTYRAGNGYTKGGDQARNECAQLFDCSIADQRVPAVDNGAHADWVGQVAEMRDGNGNAISPGKHDVSSTTVRLVLYGDQAPVPNVVGQDPNTACANVTAAGFTCKPNADQPNRQSNVVFGQSPGGGATAGIGSEVAVNYFGQQVRQLNKYYRLDDPAVHQLLVQDGIAAPPGFGVNGTIAYAFAPGTYANWNLIEYGNLNGQCGRPNDLLYSHGNPDGCMNQPTGGNGGSVLPPDGDTCGYGTKWLWRITNSLTINGKQQNSYDVVVGPSASKADAPPQGIGYNEPLGCVWQQ